MNNLASTLHIRGHTIRARVLLEEVLRTRCDLFGEGHPATKLSVAHLAGMLRSIGELVAYFRDLYTVERVEALKGPNAMIFGGVGAVA